VSMMLKEERRLACFLPVSEKEVPGGGVHLANTYLEYPEEHFLSKETTAEESGGMYELKD
jgi:hypothetical protein